MPRSVIISDASTIIGLTNIESLELLERLYADVKITFIVRNEVGLDLPSWIKVNDKYNSSVYRALVPLLDDGWSDIKRKRDGLRTMPSWKVPDAGAVLNTSFI